MKKILFLMNSFPATFSANVLCDEKVIKALQEKSNVEIHCLCYKQHKRDAEYEIIQGVQVHRVTDRAMINHIKSLEDPNCKKSIAIRNYQRFKLRVKQVIFIPIYPFYEPIRWLKIAKRAKQLNKEELFDLIISEHNGLDTLISGLYLKKKFPELKWIPIFWDALAGGFMAKYLPKTYSSKRKKSLEKEILKCCDQAIMMESQKESAMERWIDTSFWSKIQFLNIPYLVKQEQLGNGLELTKDKINILFAGSFSFRDPKNLIETFKSLQRKDVDLWFFTSSQYHDKLKKLVGDDERFHVCSYLSHRVLINTMKKADVFLNIGVGNSNAISGKIFEYMAFGKPIISTFTISNEACLPYLRKYPLTLLLDERDGKEVNVDKINDFVSNNVIGRELAYSDVAALYPTATPKAYVDMLMGIFKE